MSNPELSRRVGRIMNTDVIGAKSLDWRFGMVRAVDRATSFEALPWPYRKIVLDAEREAAQRKGRGVK